jgi:hypothetical protein
MTRVNELTSALVLLNPTSELPAKAAWWWMQLHGKPGNTSSFYLQETTDMDTVKACFFIWTLAYHSWCHMLAEMLYWVIAIKPFSSAMEVSTHYAHTVTVFLDFMHHPIFIYNIQRFRDWILSLSSGGTYSVGSNRYSKSLYLDWNTIIVLRSYLHYAQLIWFSCGMQIVRLLTAEVWIWKYI